MNAVIAAGKNLAWARAVRTFWAGLGGYAASWALLDWTTDRRASVTIVTLQIISVGIGGLVAYLVAVSEKLKTATTAGLKALYTFLQVGVPAVAAITVDALTKIEFVAEVRALWLTLIGAFFAAVATYSTNRAEGGTPAQ